MLGIEDEFEDCVSAAEVASRESDPKEVEESEIMFGGLFGNELPTTLFMI